MRDFDTYTRVTLWDDDTDVTRQINDSAKMVDTDGPWDWTYGESDSATFEINDALARDIRTKLGQPDDTKVLLTTVIEYGGYSEYTQENDYSCEIHCGPEHHWFYGQSALDNMIEWLTS